MSTAIEWTDETWNPVVGCTKASGGCDHCYAKTAHDRRHKAALAGKVIHPQYLRPFETVQLMENRLDAPLHWRKPRRVFVNSVSDLFHEDVPDEFLQRVFLTMAQAPEHTFQILTKRPDRMLNFFMRRSLVETSTPLFEAASTQWPLPNVWLGVSVENQACANYRIPLLLKVPAAVRFLSCEPLLGPVDLTDIRDRDSDYRFDALTGEEHYPGSVRTGILPALDWVIVGGESGPGARPCDIAWITAIVADCDLSGVPCFVKQLGSDPVNELGYHNMSLFTGPKHGKGGNPEHWPAELRVRQFPGEGASA